MKPWLRSSQVWLALVGVATLTLTGCASVTADQTLARVNDEASDFAQANLGLARTEDERQSRAAAARQLLAAPVGQREAVQLALVNSPALQALLAQGWANAAEAAQSGRIANPFFSFERLLAADSLDIGRSLTFGLLDVLSLPVRQAAAGRRIEQSQLRLLSDVADLVTQVRRSWVRAVAAGQMLGYARQVFDSAEASAELARRMQSTGNYNRLMRARQQAFYADAATRLASAAHQATATREELVRQLGLDEAQAQTLKLPERLPDLPSEALDPQAVAAMATRGRLDIRLAQAALDVSARAQGLNKVTSLTDLELTVRRNTGFDNAAGNRSNVRGYEVGVRLPVFDWGGMQREAWSARTLAAAHHLEATVRNAGSNLRESYSAYRVAHDIARHHRDEVLPLRKVIADENQLRYNGMLIGVFELMADARDQVGAVMAALDAEQQFWLADAALQASVIGRPTATGFSATVSAPSGGGTASH